MSGSSKRRHPKWEHIDHEAFPESYYDRAPPRRPREPLSPGRGSRRHDSRNKESTFTWDREGNNSRMSPELDERRPLHSSRSPKNGWGRSHRISKSRSRSRSRSPVPNFRREFAANDRNRGRSGASAQVCRDFAGGRCRRGNSCHFLHQEAQMYDSRRQECSSPDDWEGRRRRTGGSRYSPDDNKDNAIRTEKSAVVYNDYIKGRCRRTDSAADVFEKGSNEDVYRSRDHESRVRDSYPDLDRRSRDSYPDPDRRSRDGYPDLDRRSRDSYPDTDRRRRETYADRNHEYEPTKRGPPPCKFFAAGNCRNGTRCRFSHQVQENCSPDRRSVDDRHGADHKVEGSQGWDGPRWSDVTTVSTAPNVQGWGEEKIENKEVNTMRIQGDSRASRWSDVTSVSTVQDVKGWEEDRIEKKEIGTVMTQSVVTLGRDPDHKDAGDQAWDGPSWNDATAMSNVPVVHGWGDGKNEITEEKEVIRARPGDDPWSHNMLDINQTWDTPATIDKPQIQESKQPLQWNMEPVIHGMDYSVSRGIEKFSGDMELSPEVTKHQAVNSSTLQTSISDIALPAVQQNTVGDTFLDKHYQTGFQEQNFFNDDPYTEKNHSREDNKSLLYPGERKEKVGSHDGSRVVQSQPIHVSQGQGIFQHDQSVNNHPVSSVDFPPIPSVNFPPVSSVNFPPGQSQLPLPSQPSQGETQQLSHNPSSFLDNKVAEGSQMVSSSSSALAPGPATASGTVSNVQLAQLSHLTASLTQLLESRQQHSQFSSVVTQSMSNLPELPSPAPPVSAVIQPSQASELPKQYNPVFSSIEPKMPNLGNHLLPIVEQKISNNEQREDAKVNLQEPLASSKENEIGKNAADANVKAPENGPSQDVGADDGADDSKKLKDMKGIRPFKNALVEFVKELLKPAWKDGQVDKEAYKTIVKKVVDKVVETLGPQIPQTKEKIDLYLSCSKPKIDKLVQAYVGKHQKS